MRNMFSEKFLEWSERIKNQKLSQKSIAEWCKEQGVSCHAFHYWRRRMNENSPKNLHGMQFVKTPALDTLIEISIRGAKISISKDCDLAALIYFFSLLKSES